MTSNTKMFLKRSSGAFPSILTSVEMLLTSMQRPRGECVLQSIFSADSCHIVRDKTALWYVDPKTSEDRKMSFTDLSSASQKAANAIQSLGVKKAVCILPKVPEWWVINVGTIRSNVILLPGTTQLQV